MPITVNNEPLDPLCNSYVSIAEADSYVEDRIVSSTVRAAWSALTDDAKATFVVNATRLLDNAFEWIGHQYYREQKLRWPRYEAWVEGYYVEPTIFPVPVKEATVEVAVWMMTNDGTVAVEQPNAAYDSIKVGPINIDFNESIAGPQYKYFPDIVAYILRDYGTANNPQLPGTNQVKVVKLRRA